ncbi:hypothetical protein BG003_003202, partial [Podila horticola]
MQHHQQPYQHPAPTPTSPRMNYNNPDRSYPPQQPIGYQPGGPGGYDHTAGHHGYDMIDESDNAGLMSNQGRAGGRNNGYNKGPMPRSASRLDRAATMNRRSVCHVPLTEGNLVMDCPVPQQLLQNVHFKGEREF